MGLSSWLLFVASWVFFQTPIYAAPADATLDSSLIWTQPLPEEIVPQASDEVVPEAKAAASVSVERNLLTTKAGEGYWALTGFMTTQRHAHTATLLSNGKVLVAGGASDTVNFLASAELYDPATGVWTATGSMSVPRSWHTATLMSNGMVLVVGGEIGSNIGTVTTDKAEIYNPSTGTWLVVAYTNSTAFHTATLLNSGNVLVVGGEAFVNGAWSNATNYALGINPSYYPYWLPPPAVKRNSHAAIRLPSGQVLVTGGLTTANALINSSELYNPSTNSWTSTGSLSEGRVMAIPNAVLLANGKVLIAGATRNSSELYTPSTGSWGSKSYMSTSRWGNTVTALNSNEVLAVGGTNIFYGSISATTLDSAELYNPNSNSWRTTGSLTYSRFYFTATKLNNGKVLVAGGFGGSQSGGYFRRASAELYTPPALAAPDFVVTGITLTPVSPYRNTTFTATVTVKNLGTVAGDGKFLGVWSNQPAAQVCNAVAGKRLAVGVLAVGASKNIIFTGLAAGVAGSKKLRAFVDIGCGTAEHSETNNQLTKTYTVQ